MPDLAAGLASEALAKAFSCNGPAIRLESRRGIGADGPTLARSEQALLAAMARMEPVAAEN